MKTFLNLVKRFFVKILNLFGLAKPSKPSGPVTIMVINQSTVVLPADFAAAVAAVQKQLSGEFKAAWGITVTLITGPVTAGSWGLCYIRDTSDAPGDLGYHNPGNTPTAYVFAKDCATYGEPWTVTLSHEVLEMLVDPQLKTYSGGKTSQFEEICDPVETFSYSIDGVQVSDFVFPSFYKTGATGPYDQLAKTTAPLTWVR